MPGGGGGAGVRKGARGKYSAVSLGLQSGHAHTFHLGVLRLCLPELGGWGVGQFPRPWGGGADLRRRFWETTAAAHLLLAWEAVWHLQLPWMRWSRELDCSPSNILLTPGPVSHYQLAREHSKSCPEDVTG